MPASATQYFVDAAVAAGGDGSADHPFKLIQQGVDLAKAGDTVVVRKGTYLEQIHLHTGGTAESPLTIRAEPLGSVIVDGADPIQGFKEDEIHSAADKSKVWVCRDYHSPYIPMDNDFNLRTDWLKEGLVGKQQVELCSRNDMIWLDGRFLDEVDTADQLVFGTFWVDRENGGLYLPLIKSDRPADHLIEAAERGTLFSAGAHSSFVHLRGFHFTRAATGRGEPIMKVGGNGSEHWVVEDNVADWGSWSGIQIYGRYHEILRNLAANNGDEGMHGTLRDTVLDGNSSLHNNWKGIRDTYESGGGKFTESDNVTVRNHLAAYNRGPGLWFDIWNKSITVEHSQFHDNKYAGIFMEISYGPTEIRGNTCWANQGAGILIGESMKSVMENNVSAFNWYGIELRNLQDRHDRFGNAATGYTDVTWQVSDVDIHGNTLLKNTRAGIANTSFYLDPVAERISSDKNVFYGSDLIWWRTPGKNGTNAKAPTPSNVAAIKDGFWTFDGKIFNNDGTVGLGLDQHSTWSDPGFVDDDMYQFLKPQQVATPK